MRNRTKPVAWLLSAAIMFSFMAPAALAAQEEQVISIATAEDLVKLSANCSLDSWSQGKIIRLEADIDLAGTDYSPIPTFGGTFEGQGHTISGLRLEESGNTQGLFRYIQTTGVVSDLTVEGTVEPSGRKNTLGGIVGSNQGMLANCTFIGDVSGKNHIGGLAGINEKEGQMINCSFQGSVQGEHYTGGIAGQNLGSVIQCENLGNINTVEIEVSLDQEDMNPDQLNAAENTPVCTDIGGIAGFSSGILQNCVNQGNVGYEHVGYNIGGIAGRQSGYLDGCQNAGEILGRKDVGGIVGQLEPELLLKYNEGNIGKLLDELDQLQDLMGQTTDDLSWASDHTSSQMKSISEKTQTAQDLLGDLAESGTDWANDNLESLDDVLSRVSWTVEHLISVSNTGSDAMYQMKTLSRQLKEVFEEADIAADLGAEAAADLRASMEDLQRAAEDGIAALGHLKEALDHLKNGLGQSSQTEEAMEEIDQAISQLRENASAIREDLSQMEQVINDADIQDKPQWQQMAEAIGNLETAAEAVSESFGQIEEAVRNAAEVFGQAQPESLDLGELEQVYQSLKEASESMKQAVLDLGEAMTDGIEALKGLEALGNQLEEVGKAIEETCSQMGHMSFLLSDMGNDLAEIFENLAERPSISIYSISGTMRDQQDALDDVLSSLLDDGDALQNIISDSSDMLIDDLKAINDQFGAITETLRDMVNHTGEESVEDHFEDISEQEISAQDTGYLSNSENTGHVEGDINVAGVAGSMAVEYDFDPEDDLKKSGDRSPDFRYQARAVVAYCVNRGEVTAKKDYSGGIAGRMDLGRITACEGYGTVTGADGNYTGGIAGASWGSIHDSWAKCRLSGNDYVGGIAGSGNTIQNCRALVQIEDGEACVGAVAGWMQEDGTLEQNTFASLTLAAVDGISYAGKAEPVSFETLCATEGVPDGFSDLELTFLAEGEVVAVIPFSYGGAIETLPEIPEKEGYSAAWPDMDYGCLTASQTLEAEYTPDTSAISDGKEVPEILVDGSFGSQAEISYTTQDVSWTDEKGKAHSGTAYTVALEEPLKTDYRVHYRLTDPEKDHTLWVQSGEGTWAEQAYTADGQYLMFDCAQPEVTFCVTENSGQAMGLVTGVSAGAICVIAGLLVYRRKKSRASGKN